MKDNFINIKAYCINYCHKCVAFEKNFYYSLLEKFAILEKIRRLLIYIIFL